jgi:hypothetical protein
MYRSSRRRCAARWRSSSEGISAAASRKAALGRGDRTDLAAFLDAAAEIPSLDDPHLAAHRRLLERYIRYHLAEGAALPALEFWITRSWAAA